MLVLAHTCSGPAPVRPPYTFIGVCTTKEAGAFSAREPAKEMAELFTFSALKTVGVPFGFEVYPLIVRLLYMAPLPPARASMSAYTSLL